jgi:hypothetical protein
MDATSAQAAMRLLQRRVHHKDDVIFRLRALLMTDRTTSEELAAKHA